jgi:hypothetical protein
MSHKSDMAYEDTMHIKVKLFSYRLSEHDIKQMKLHEALHGFISLLGIVEVINPLKLSGNYMSTESIYGFRMILSVNSDYFLQQH